MTSISFFRLAKRFLVSTLSGLAIASGAFGQGVDASWTTTGNGNWSLGTNWSPQIPNGVDHIANIVNQIGANRTITIDGGIPSSTVTLGALIMGDLSGGQSNTITGGTLVFDVSTGTARLAKINDGGNDTISSAIRINDQLDITVNDPSNNQGLSLNGVISGGTAGTVTMTFNDLSAGANVNWLLISNNNTFAGQMVVESGVLRYETNNGSAGARGVGNESIARLNGTIDLRDRDFAIGNVNDTEIFIIGGFGENGIGALRNTAGTSNLSHLILESDSMVGGYSSFDLMRHTNQGNTTEIAAILDMGGHALSKMGTNEFRIHDAEILNMGTFNVYEGELKFENNGTLLGGTPGTYGNNLNGAVINVYYNRNAYDGSNPLNGTRTFDPYNPPSTHTALTGNGISDARVSFATIWTGTTTHPANVKVVDTFDNLTVNLNNGTWQREGNGEAGRTFDQIFGPNVTINLVKGGVGRDDTGSGNLFDIQGGSGSFNATTGVWDHPGVTELQGRIDNISAGNLGTGFTVRGSREMRITGNQTHFNGDILIKQPTNRWVTNTFSSTHGGQPTSEYTNMSLAGASGSFNQANSITLTRWGSLALLNNSANSVYASANHNDRLNDNGFLNLRDGFVKLETDVATTNTENFGHVVADFGTNFLFLDTRAGGGFDGSIQSLTRNNNGLLKIYSANPNHTFGNASSDVRLRVNDPSGIVTVGTGSAGSSSAPVVLGVFGTSLPSDLSTPTLAGYTRPLASVQGSFMFAGAGMKLMTLDGGYLRPLLASEYAAGMTPTAGTNWLLNGYISATGGNYSDRNNYAARNVTSDIAVNSLTVGFSAGDSGQVLPAATQDSLIIETGRTLTIDSGIINFNSYGEANSLSLEGVIRGGNLNMNGQVALINAGTAWQDLDLNDPDWFDFMRGNSTFIRSHIINASGLVKTGRSNLYLDTSNDFTGNIYLSEQGALVVRHPDGLGKGAPGREVQIGGGAAFLLEYGTNVKGVDVRVTNTTQASATILRGEGTTHNSWMGNVILDVADGYGTSELQSYTVTARNDGTLTVGGNLYTDNNANLTDSDSFADSPLITTSIGETYTVNLRGQVRDIATGNLGTDPANAGITSIARTGDSTTRLDSNHSLRFQMSGHDEGNVNVFQQWDATGRLDLRQGYFRIQYDPATAAGSGGFYTDGARSLITANDYLNRAVLGADGSSTTANFHTHLMLTKPGQVFNAPYIYSYNDNREGTQTIGGENESGTVYYGSVDNSLNFSIQYVNQSTERDIRFLQVRGGTMVFNGRLDDENGTVDSFNASVSIVGPGTVVFNRNNIGNSDIDRWNFMGGETRWEIMNGNNVFARTRGTSTNAIGGISGWGGGGLVLDAQTTSRTQTLDGNIYLFNGASYVNTQQNTIFTMGAASPARTLDRRSGSSLAFLEDGNGAINITADGLSTTDGAFLGAWAVYGSSTGGVTDWAGRQGTTGVQAFTGYSANAFGAGMHSNLTANQVLGGNTETATVRFGGATNLQIGSGNVLTLSSGGLLVPATQADAISVTGGSMTSGWASGSHDLMIHHYGSGDLTLSSVLTNNGSNRVNLVHVGSGRTILDSPGNTYTGDTYVNGGTLVIDSDSDLGVVNASIARIIRVAIGSDNNANVTAGNLAFTTSVAPTTAANGTYASNGSQQVSTLTLGGGGSGYTSGVYVSTDKNNDGTPTGDGNAGIMAIMDSGNLYLNNGTLQVTETMTLNGARTIFLGSNGGTLSVNPGKTLTINGYISSEFSHVTTGNGYTTVNHDSAAWQSASDRNPDIGDLIIAGGGTVVMTGAPDGTVRVNQYNSYGGITWINDGILRIASHGSSLDGLLGTNRSWIDGTIIGANGTLLLNTTSDPTIREWFTFRGQGYQGSGTIQTVGTARTYRLAGQLFLEEDVVVNNKNGSNVRFNESGGTMYGTGDVVRIGNGALQFYNNAPDWTGAIRNSGRDLWVTSAGNLGGLTGLTMTRDSILYLEVGSTAVDEFRDRLPDNLPIETDGYVRMRLRPTAGMFSGEERVGVATVKGGQLGLEFDIGADIFNGANRLQGDYGIWHFDQIIRSPGTSVHMRSLDSGTEFAGADFMTTQWQNVVGVQVDTAPVLLGTGDGLNGNVGIVSGFFGGVRPSWINLAGTGNVFSEEFTANRLVTTAVAANGNIYLRPLLNSEYRELSHPNLAVIERLDLAAQGITADQNLKIVGVISDLGIGSGNLGDRRDSILSLDGNLAINSLTFESESFVFDNRATSSSASGGNWGNWTNITMTAGSELTIHSGMIISANTGVMDVGGQVLATNWNASMPSSINGGALNFAGQEAHFNVTGLWAHYNTSDSLNAYRTADNSGTELYINSPIRNATNLIKTGPNSLILTSANEYTGNTYINHGLIYARNDRALGNGTDIFVQGTGGFVVSYSSLIQGKTLNIGALSGNNIGLLLQEGSSWDGRILVDNIDAAGGTSYIRSYTPRIANDHSYLATIRGTLSGGNSVIGASGLTDSRMFTTYDTGNGGLLQFRGTISDTPTGAVSGPITLSNQNQVLRMEIVTDNNEHNIEFWNAHDAAGRIRLLQGILTYQGTNEFYTAAAAAAANSDPLNPLIGFQMGGRSILSADGSANDDLAFFLANDNAHFNLSSWEVGVESYDVENLSGNDNYGRGNTAGNSTLGGLNLSGQVTFGTGSGSIIFTDSPRLGLYSGDLRLYAAEAGEVNLAVNLLDGGAFVDSSITKIGTGVVNLLGSTAGAGTVEAVHLLGGTLRLTNYDQNSDRRVGVSAALLMGGGRLVLDGSSGTPTESFSNIRIREGASSLMASGSATIQLNGSLNRSSGGTLHLQSTSGGVIQAPNLAGNTRLGSYATFGSSSGLTPFATDWAATNGTGQIVAFTGYTVDTMGAGIHTDLQGANVAGGTTGSLRFDTAGGSIGSGNVVLQDGGLLITSNHIGGTILASGVGLTTGATGTDLLIHNYAQSPITLAGNITGAQKVVFTGSGTTLLNGTNSYSGATHIMGGSVVAVDDFARFGSTSSLYLNGGTIRYTSPGMATTVLSKPLVLGGNGGVIEVSEATGRIVLRGAANQISSDANPVTAITTGNPFSGGMSFLGTGVIQFGDRNAAGDVQDIAGVMNTYTGLTIVGNGVDPLRIDLQGQGNDNEQYTPFGTTYSWADGTILRNNVTLELSMRRGDGSRDNQVRLREWFQIGEKAGDVVTFDGTTQRQPTFDGMLNIIGNLVINVRGNLYGNAGGTGNSEFLFMPNEGGIFGTGDIIKTGAGNVRIYQNLREWTGDMDLRAGRTYIQSFQTSMFESTGHIYMGDPNGTDATAVSLRVEPRFGNSTTALDSGLFLIDVSRDITIRDNLNQEARIEVGYGPNTHITYSGDIHVGAGSKLSGGNINNQVRFNVEDTTSIDGSLTGIQQRYIMEFAGNLSGSNNIMLEHNQGGSVNDSHDQFTTFYFSGDNSGLTSKITVGVEQGTGTGNFDRDDIETLRFGSSTALTSANVVEMRNLSTLQAGGQSVTIGNLITNDGNTTTGIYSFTSPTWAPNRQTTADLDAKGGTSLDGTTGMIVSSNYTPLGDSSAIIENASATPGTIKISQSVDAVWDAYFRDGVPDGHFDSITSAPGSLSIEKLGSGHATINVFNDYTGTTTVSEGTLQVGAQGDGYWTSLTQGTRTVDSSGYGGLQIVGSTGTGTTIVGANGTLTGSGHIRGDLQVNGRLSPGDYNGGTFEEGGVEGTLFVGGPGLVGNVTFNPGSITTLQIMNATTFDYDLAVRTYEIASGAAYENHVAGIPAANQGMAANPDYFGQSGTEILSGSVHDHLEIGGNMTWNGGLIEVVFSSYYPQAGDVFNLIDWYGIADWGSFNIGSSRYMIGNGDDNGDFRLPDLSVFDSTLRWDTGLWAQHGILTIAYAPEPGRALLLCIGVVALLMRRRR